MPWKRMLAYITGSVNEDLLRRIEYLLEGAPRQTSSSPAHK
jgi:hypothetical protein